MNWSDSGVLQALADAVAEIAGQLESIHLPVDPRAIARLIWRDDRALDYQAVVVRAILRARGVAHIADPSAVSGP